MTGKKMEKHNGKTFFFNSPIEWNENRWDFTDGRNIYTAMCDIYDSDFAANDVTNIKETLGKIFDSETHWVKEIIGFWMDEFARRAISSVWCNVYQNSIGNEKEKARLADAAKKVYEEKFA